MNFPYWMVETPRANTSWGDLEDGHLLSSLEKGVCIKDMAKEHGRSLVSILCRLRTSCPQFKSYLQDRENVDKRPFQSSNIQDVTKDLRFIFEKYDNKGNLIVEPVRPTPPTSVIRGAHEAPPPPPTMRVIVEGVSVGEVEESKGFPLSYLAIGLSIVAIIMSAIAVHGG